MRRIGLVAAAGAALGLAGAALGQGADFASATVLNIGTNNPTTVSGAVSIGTLTEILNENYSVAVGSIYERRLSMVDHGLSAGAAFTLYTGPGYDSELRLLDDALAQIAQNDDGGPFGSSPNWGSQLNGAVNSDGSINFDITYYTDNSFAGASTGGGSYWSLNTVMGAVTGQWWAFTGLTPGGMFEAETTLGTLGDTVLAAWDSSGALLGSDDDGGSGLASLLSGTVPADGTVYISVSGYHGFSGQGTQAYYTTGGDDTGDFTLRFIPTPGSFALLGLGGLMAVRRRR